MKLQRHQEETTCRRDIHRGRLAHVSAPTSNASLEDRYQISSALCTSPRCFLADTTIEPELDSFLSYSSVRTSRHYGRLARGTSIRSTALRDEDWPVRHVHVPRHLYSCPFSNSHGPEGSQDEEPDLALLGVSAVALGGQGSLEEKTNRARAALL